MEKEIQYSAINTYDTLNELSVNTKNVWVVFHGIGYLSRYFINHFSALNAEENYIICPQAPAKYYKDENYRKVGACWLTKENTLIDIENVLNYIDAILKNEGITKNHKLILFGYSQGVSIASRWVGLRKNYADLLICASGAFPAEFTDVNFTHVPNLKFIHSVGTNDPLFEKKNVVKQEQRMKALFPKCLILNHNGGHHPEPRLFEAYLKV